ncbi:MULTISPECIES: phage baseplate protein [Fusobacterium]|jgi:hypothetical protein|uniref:phage baseplate protein n=1 Tax=Fusobacterium TaxID=848 RepID=UPI000E9978D5|nr:MULTISPECIES: hypothetical protein [Fusobacterium]DAE77837.1 MAG TPA: baseplate protein [Caudoviricetes sp.]HBJ79719.1 hypothetical protein [Fusobacterium sp.]
MAELEKGNASIIPFENMSVEFPERYRVTREDGTVEIQTIQFDPGTIYSKGTEESAENFNTVQKNCIYNIVGTHKMEGVLEIFEGTIEGIDKFGMFDLNLIMIPTETNTTVGCVIRIAEIEFTIVNARGSIDIGDLEANNLYLFKLDAEKRTAMLMSDYSKLKAGSVSEDYNTAKKIEDKLSQIEEKFKNFCPFPVNSIFLSLDNSNPATLFLGTTWEKQEGRFLIGSSLDYPLGTTGGNSTITLTEANMPRHRHQVDTVSATVPAHTHPYKIGGGNYGGPGNSEGGLGGTKYTGNTLSAGGGSTGAIAPYTNYVGSGTAFNNMPPYLVCNIWKRLS